MCDRNKMVKHTLSLQEILLLTATEQGVAQYANLPKVNTNGAGENFRVDNGISLER
jgi:hypothetical protein